jgi:hypothetical protein
MTNLVIFILARLTPETACGALPGRLSASLDETRRDGAHAWSGNRPLSLIL